MNQIPYFMKQLLYATFFFMISLPSGAQKSGKINYLKNVQYYKAQKLSSAINSSSDESYPVISPDGKTLYFTREGHQDNIEYQEDKKDQDIWFAKLTPLGQWSKAKNIGCPVNEGIRSLVNIPNINTLIIWGAPLGYTGVKISQRTATGWSRPRNFYRHMTNRYKIAENIFVGSNLKTVLVSKKGDLKVIFKIDQQKWSKPLDLGKIINTNAEESVAFLASDNTTLYFASKGHPGFGGSDLFVSRRLDDTWQNWSKPINLGPSINTKEDESGLYMPASGNVAYFHRGNREEGRDIYRVKMPTKLRSQAVVLISGKVMDAKTKKPIGTNITYRNLTSNENVGFSSSDPKDGTYEVALPSGNKYGYFAPKKGYYPISQYINLTNLKNYKEVKVNLFITPLEKGAKIRLNNLFFMTASVKLQQESFAELNRLVYTLKEYPQMVIQINGHTDSHGSQLTNKQLSENRAYSVYAYLSGKGIDKKRLKVKGFGSSQPVAPNHTKAGRQQNRRVEFEILQKGE